MELDNKTGRLTRREFVAVGALSGAVAAVGCKAGLPNEWEHLSKEQASTLAAICDQILPADDYPSASEAGVLTYMDRQLTRAYRRHQEAYRSGLEEAEGLCRKRFGQALASLTPVQQLAAVKDLETWKPSFFELVRQHTMEGYYGSPRHGGNHDAVSWKMLGLDEPPVRGRAQFDLTKDGGQ
jgi:gluconate 2-dehydrogenase gamma chain